MAQNEDASDYYQEFMHNAWRQTYGMPSIPYFGDSMSADNIPGGKVSDAFRGGTRSEYLAHYGLSRFAFVYQVPRQEDFGIVDFLCVLGAAKKPRLVYPEDSFYVQVKANRNNFNLSADSINWVRNHMNLPLYVCVADKSDDSLSFYTTSVLWLMLFQVPTITGITITLDKPSDNGFDTLSPDAERDHKDIQYIAHLGKPFLVTNLADLESGKSATAYAVLKKWIQIENINIVSKNMGGLFSQHIGEWELNQPPIRFLQNYYHDKDYLRSELQTATHIVALTIGYISQLRNNRLSAAEKDLLQKKAVCLREYLKMASPTGAHIVDDFISKMDKHPLPKAVNAPAGTSLESDVEG